MGGRQRTANPPQGRPLIPETRSREENSMPPDQRAPPRRRPGVAMGRLRKGPDTPASTAACAPWSADDWRPPRSCTAGIESSQRAQTRRTPRGRGTWQRPSPGPKRRRHKSLRGPGHAAGARATAGAHAITGRRRKGTTTAQGGGQPRRGCCGPSRTGRHQGGQGRGRGHRRRLPNRRKAPPTQAQPQRST